MRGFAPEKIWSYQGGQLCLLLAGLLVYLFGLVFEPQDASSTFLLIIAYFNQNIRRHSPEESTRRAGLGI
jgi:hypothetical protein